MYECVVCGKEITDGSESSLQLSEAAKTLLKKELGYDAEAVYELSICTDCIEDIIADYFV